MSIHVKVDLNGWQALANYTLTRVTNIDYDVPPPDAVSSYRCRRWGVGLEAQEVFVDHRYGDGHEALVVKALQALGGAA